MWWCIGIVFVWKRENVASGNSDTLKLNLNSWKEREREEEGVGGGNDNKNKKYKNKNNSREKYAALQNRHRHKLFSIKNWNSINIMVKNQWIGIIIIR